MLVICYREDESSEKQSISFLLIRKTLNVVHTREGNGLFKVNCSDKEILHTPL